MGAFANSHVSVLDDGPAILVENVLLAEFTKRGTRWEHHIGSLIDRPGITCPILQGACLDATWRVVRVPVGWACVVVMVENDRTWVLNDHLVAIVACLVRQLLVPSEHPRAELVDETACFALTVAYASCAAFCAVCRVFLQVGVHFVAVAVCLRHAGQTVVECLLGVQELRDVRIDLLLHRQFSELVGIELVDVRRLQMSTTARGSTLPTRCMHLLMAGQL